MMNFSQVYKMFKIHIFNVDFGFKDVYNLNNSYRIVCAYLAVIDFVALFLKVTGSITSSSTAILALLIAFRIFTESNATIWPFLFCIFSIIRLRSLYSLFAISYKPSIAHVLRCFPVLRLYFEFVLCSYIWCL